MSCPHKILCWIKDPQNPSQCIISSTLNWPCYTNFLLSATWWLDWDTVITFHFFSCPQERCLEWYTNHMQLQYIQIFTMRKSTTAAKFSDVLWTTFPQSYLKKCRSPHHKILNRNIQFESWYTFSSKTIHQCWLQSRSTEKKTQFSRVSLILQVWIWSGHIPLLPASLVGVMPFTQAALCKLYKKLVTVN